MIANTVLPVADRLKGNGDAIVTLKAAQTRAQELHKTKEEGSGKKIGLKLGNIAALQAMMVPADDDDDFKQRGK